jgi:hypothetical protein
LFCFNPKDPVAIVEVEIDPAPGKLAQQARQHPFCGLIVFYVRFENFNHEILRASLEIEILTLFQNFTCCMFFKSLADASSYL